MSDICPKYGTVVFPDNEIVPYRLFQLNADEPPLNSYERALGEQNRQLAAAKAALNPPFSHRADCDSPAMGVICLTCDQKQFEAWYKENEILLARNRELRAALRPFAEVIGFERRRILTENDWIKAAEALANNPPFPESKTLQELTREHIGLSGKED